MELVRDAVRIQFVRLGEGYFGDFDPDDEDDAELLRFDVERNVDGCWEPVPCGSWCTLLPAAASQSVCHAALDLLMRELYGPVVREESLKAIAERLSSMNPQWFEEPDR